jgi:hypothetical protein
VPGGYSPLPEFSRVCGLPLYFLDLHAGAQGLRACLERLVVTLGLDTAELIDTGGDVLARGDEPGITSPMMDALVLSASHGLPCETLVSCAGLGLDGELTAVELEEAKSRLSKVEVAFVPSAIATRIYSAFSWFPSETSLLMLHAAMGLHGTVDLVAQAQPVPIDRSSAAVFSFDAAEVFGQSLLAPAVASSTSFQEADRAIREVGAPSEYRSELSKADTTPPPPHEWVTDLSTIAALARPRGTHVTLRRLARATNLNSRPGLAHLDRLLSDRFRAAYRKPLLQCAAFDAVKQYSVSMPSVLTP